MRCSIELQATFLPWIGSLGDILNSWMACEFLWHGGCIDSVGWRYWVTAIFLSADNYNHHSWWVCTRSKEYIFLHNSRPQFWQGKCFWQRMICSLITGVLSSILVLVCSNVHFHLKPFCWLTCNLLLFKLYFILRQPMNQVWKEQKHGRRLRQIMLDFCTWLLFFQL